MMRTALVFACAMALLSLGTGRILAEDPPKLYWYDVVVSMGQTTETITGASEMEPDEFSQVMSGDVPVYLDHIRIQGVRAGDSAVKWHPQEGRSSVYIRPQSIIIIYKRPGDPAQPSDVKP